MLNQVLNKIDTAGIETSRRHFLLGSAAVAGGLLVGFKPLRAVVAGNALNGYIHIGSNNKVTILSSQFDMGQGPYHGIATLVIEELGADWSQIDVQGAAGNTKLYGNLMWGGAVQGTGGSTSMATSYDRYRQAGAAAREMLVAAAAKDWGVPATQISVAGGRLKHASGRSATFGKFAADAAKMPAPKDVKLKDASSWTQIGNPDLRRFDSAPKANGTHDFTIDLKLDGMLTAVIAHPPKFGATVKSFDATAAKNVRGVTDVVQIPRGVAVVAEHMWAAIKGREALTVEWDESQAETRGSAEILAQYRKQADNPPQASARKEGDTASAMASAAKVVDATYEFPYLAHAAMEPHNAVARRNADGTLEVWGGHQIPDLYQAISAKIAGITPDKVTMHVMKTGGRYRPAYIHRFRAGLDSQGNLIAWENHIVGQSIVQGTPFAGLIQNGIDKTSVEGASNIPYGIPNISVGLTTSDVKVPVLWWRAVGSTHTAYAVESFLDEVAAEAGKDPYTFRMELLKDHPRHAAVLKLAAEKAG